MAIPTLKIQLNGDERLALEKIAIRNFRTPEQHVRYLIDLEIRKVKMSNKFGDLEKFIDAKLGQERQEGFKERELMEIKFALMYDEDFDHGTDGHSRLKLIAKLARLCTDEQVKLVAQDIGVIMEPYEG